MSEEQEKNKKPEPVKKKKKEGAFWKSSAAIRAYMVFGLPLFGLLAWYAYTVVFEFQKEAMTKFEDKMGQKIKAVAQRALKEGFAVKDYNVCQAMIDEYTTPKGWTYTDAALHELVGLPANATKEQLENRCIYYAKAVAQMEKISHHTRHVFVCGESAFYVSKSGKQYIKADPKGRGAIENLTTGKERLVAIPPEQSKIFNMWQIYNSGKQCIIVGLSKSGTFSMSGHVEYK